LKEKETIKIIKRVEMPVKAKATLITAAKYPPLNEIYNASL
jgi:hypothetical protein